MAWRVGMRRFDGRSAGNSVTIGFGFLRRAVNHRLALAC
jgi:hypothetical protein